MSRSEKSSRNAVGGRLSFALAGHRNSGKTALLATALKLGDQSLHSFPEELPVLLPDSRSLVEGDETGSVLEQISDQVIESLSNGGHYAPTPTERLLNHDIRLDFYKKRKARTRRRFFGKQSEAVPDPTERGAFDSIPLTVTDIAGNLLFPGTVGTDGVVSRERRRMQDAEAWISKVRQVMVCMPCTFQAEGDATVVLDYVRLFNRLRSPDCQVERLILCLTKYETRWTAFGREAIDAALDPQEFARAAFEVVLEDDAMRRALLGLMGKKAPSGRPVEICLCPVSVYGFVTKNGCANYDLHKDGMLIQAPGDGGKKFRQRSFGFYDEREARRYWQPFLIVDPFMYLATGQYGRLTMPLDTFI